MRNYFQCFLCISCCLMLLWSVSLNAATFTYSYDSLNRLTNAAYSDGSSERYSYDNAGNRLSRSTSAETTNFDLMPPTVPDGLFLDASSPSQMSISWQPSHDFGYHLLNPDTYIDGSGLAGYQIYLNGSLLTTTTIANFTLTGLSPNTSYCLAIAAFDHEDNVSDQSLPICYTTPAFQPPYLVPSGFQSGHFQIAAVGGTPGPYDVWGSSNLFDWQRKSTVWLPFTNAYFTDPDSNVISPYFYRFAWSTNTP